MKISAAGIAALEAREGKRMLAYRDSVGVLTIGVGHTGRMAPPAVRAGMRIDQDECDAFLAADLAPLDAALAKALKVPVTQNEWDALASLGFNIGESGEVHSTVIKRLNVGDIAGAADAFLMWEKPAALAGRREAERKQFLTPDAGTKSVAAARSGVLDAKAGKTLAKAATITKTAAATIVVGGAGSAAAVAAHPAAALTAGSLVGLAAIVQALAAWWHTRRAAELAANASAQRAVAA